MERTGNRDQSGRSKPVKMDETSAGRRPEQEEELGYGFSQGGRGRGQEREAWRRRLSCLLAATACCAALASWRGEQGPAKWVVEGQEGVWTMLEGEAAAATPAEAAPASSAAGKWDTGNWGSLFEGWGGSWANQYSSCRDSPAGCIGIDRGIEIFVPVILFLAVGAGVERSLDTPKPHRRTRAPAHSCAHTHEHVRRHACDHAIAHLHTRAHSDVPFIQARPIPRTFSRTLSPRYTF